MPNNLIKENKYNCDSMNIDETRALIFDVIQKLASLAGMMEFFGWIEPLKHVSAAQRAMYQLAREECGPIAQGIIKTDL